jgi:hypothetical protein
MGALLFVCLCVTVQMTSRIPYCSDRESNRDAIKQSARSGNFESQKSSPTISNSRDGHFFDDSSSSIALKDSGREQDILVFDAFKDIYRFIQACWGRSQSLWKLAGGTLQNDPSQQCRRHYPQSSPCHCSRLKCLGGATGIVEEKPWFCLLYESVNQLHRLFVLPLHYQ